MAYCASATPRLQYRQKTRDSKRAVSARYTLVMGDRRSRRQRLLRLPLPPILLSVQIVPLLPASHVRMTDAYRRSGLVRSRRSQSSEFHDIANRVDTPIALTAEIHSSFTTVCVHPANPPSEQRPTVPKPNAHPACSLDWHGAFPLSSR